jgi:hypothetical protein
LYLHKMQHVSHNDTCELSYTLTTTLSCSSKRSLNPTWGAALPCISLGFHALDSFFP